MVIFALLTYMQKEKMQEKLKLTLILTRLLTLTLNLECNNLLRMRKVTENNITVQHSQ